MNVQRKEKGFTIIEVVLVLAIAGLIFLMVFIALPSLQRSQRDTQRKSDLARISTQITNYSSSNSGEVPTNAQVGAFVKGYLGGTTTSTTKGTASATNYKDPSTDLGYVVTGSTSSIPSGTAAGNIYYDDQATCGTDGVFTTATSKRTFAIEIVLENQTAPYCIDNSNS